MSSHEAEGWTRKEIAGRRRSEIWRVAEIVERFVVREVSEVVADHRETSPASFSGRKEASSGHHAARHLFHPALFASFVLEPDLKIKH